MTERSVEPTDSERLMLHLIDVDAAESGLECPVCGKRDWDIIGLVVAPDADPPRPGVIAGRPMMQVACCACFYLLHFLWEPIRRKRFPPEALEALRQRLDDLPSTAP